MKEVENRYAWMDSLRGAAIILVIHFHVTENISKYPDAPQILIDLTNVINVLNR